MRPAFFIIGVLQPGFIPAGLSILFFSYAAIAAMVAPSIHADRNSENVTLWDIAGAFTLTGCTAAIFSEPDQVALHSSSNSNGPRMRHGRSQSPARLVASRLSVPDRSVKKPASKEEEDGKRDPCLNFWA